MSILSYKRGVMNGLADFSFSVFLDDRERALGVLEKIQDEIGFRETTSEDNLVKVSIVGAGMVSTPGVAATMFEELSKLGISINMVSTSEIKISCVIAASHLTEAVQALHTAYGLDTKEQAFIGGPKERR